MDAISSNQDVLKSEALLTNSFSIHHNGNLSLQLTIAAVTNSNFCQQQVLVDSSVRFNKLCNNSEALHLSFTKDHYNKLLVLIQPPPQQQHSAVSHINTLSTKFQPESGNTFPNCSHVAMSELDSWIIDSEATDHIVNNLGLFISYQQTHNLFVKLSNSQTVKVTHIGNVFICPTLTLPNALFGPHFTFNLISVSRLLQNPKYCLTF